LCDELSLTDVTRFDHLLALCHGLGLLQRHDEAHAALGDAAELCERVQLGGIHRGRLAEARIEAALRRGDVTAAEAHLDELTERYASCGIARLTARYVRLRESVRRRDSGVRASNPPPSWTRASEVRQEVREVVASCQEPQERALRALTVLMEAAGAARGVLFVPGPDGLEPRAMVGMTEPDPEMLSIAQQRLDAQTWLDEETRIESPTQTMSELTSAAQHGGARALLLMAGRREGGHVAGVAVLSMAANDPTVHTHLYVVAEEVADALDGKS
jgi:hypothetical protein